MKLHFVFTLLYSLRANKSFIKIHNFYISFLIKLKGLFINVSIIKLNLRLDELIFTMHFIFKIKHILVCFILGSTFFCLSIKNIIFHCLYELCFLSSLYIMLTMIIYYVISNKQLRTKNNKFYHLIRYFLMGALFIVTIFFISLFVFFIYSLLNLLLIKITNTKLWNSLKISNNYNGTEPPKSPKTPENASFFSGLRNKKKIHKDIAKKAKEMKDKLMDLQRKKLEDNSDLTNDNNIAGLQNREWNNTIILENRPTLSLKEQLDKLNSEFKAYKNQNKKFRKIIKDIEKGKEEFFPSESKSLFKEYIEVIDQLNVNLRKMKKNLKNHK